jgi:hypothetical protein
MKKKIKGEDSDEDTVNKEKRFTGHNYVRYLRKEELKGDINDQDSYLCPAFVLYERIDILNSQTFKISSSIHFLVYNLKKQAQKLIINQALNK